MAPDVGVGDKVLEKQFLFLENQGIDEIIEGLEEMAGMVEIALK
jgi:hypothetical protein